MNIKKICLLLLCVCMLFSFCACDNTSNDMTHETDKTSITERESTTTVTTTTVFVTTTTVARRIVHVALQGAVITYQDGSGMYKYVHKCDSCGDVEDNLTITSSGSSGTSNSSFACKECGQRQKVVIKHYRE